MARRFALGACASLLALFMALGLVFIRANAQTADEAFHLVAGYSYLMREDFRLNREHPPLAKQLSALGVYLRYRLPFQPDPELWQAGKGWTMGANFVYRSSVPADDILAAARLPMLLLGAALVGLVGWWAYRLWGPGAAVVATALAALEPNLVAHASLVTTDVGVALFSFLAVYLLWEHVRAPSWGRLVGVGLATGLALATKFSAILLPGILAVAAGGYLLLGDEATSPSNALASVEDPAETERSSRAAARTAPRAGPRRVLMAVIAGVIVLVVAAAVVLGTYFVHGAGAWTYGLRKVLTHQDEGHPAFFLGAYSNKGWWSYFLVAFLIKTPVGTLALVLASLALWRAGEPLRRREMLFLLLPAALFLAVMTRVRINIGLRHVLMIYPFLFVAASRLATLRWRPAWVVPLLLATAVAATAASSLRVAPHQLAYFNELVGGPGEGYRYLGDSNIDWGQDLKGLKAYMDRERLPMVYLAYFGTVPPAAYGVRYQYAPAFGNLRNFAFATFPETLERRVLAISVLNLQGIWFQEPDLYHWLYRRTPVAKIGYSIFVYDLTGDADAHVRLATVYLKEHLPHLAAPELRRALRLDPANAEAAGLLATLPAGS